MVSNKATSPCRGEVKRDRHTFAIAYNRFQQSDFTLSRGSLSSFETEVGKVEFVT
ncbi:hypothetical protein [Iningainema tapete]|uniref:hypothetical protein n=1 Tax=Iningainema tapete TaxID=2806730 RepID=UPI003B588AA3